MQLFTSILFLAFAFGYVGLTNSYAQDAKIPSGWKKVSVCQISFLIPKNLKNRNVEGTDSCVALFSNNKMSVGIDYGSYGGAFKPYKDFELDFKEESILIDGKEAKLATFIDTRYNPSRKFSAGIYVLLDEGKKNEFGMETSLNMIVTVEREKEIEIAKRIFQSIRFGK